MRRWRQSFRDCKLEKKEEVGVHRRQVMAAWRPCGSIFIALGANGIENFVYKGSKGKWERCKGRCQEEKEEEGDEQEQGRISQQLVLPAPGGINEGTPAGSLKLDLPRVWSAPGECGGAGKSGTRGLQERFIKLSKSTSNGRGCTCGRLVNGNRMRKTFVKNEKKRATARVRTRELLIKSRRCGDLSALETNSQEKDLRENLWKGLEFRKTAKGKEVEAKDEREKEEQEEGEAQKKKLVEKAQRRDGKCLFTTRMKEEKKEKEGRKRDIRPRVTQVLVTSGSWFLLLVLRNVGKNATTGSFGRSEK